MFSDSDSENEDVHQFTINEHYAKAFEYRKEREELAKCTSLQSLGTQLLITFSELQ